MVMDKDSNGKNYGLYQGPELSTTLPALLALERVGQFQTKVCFLNV